MYCLVHRIVGHMDITIHRRFNASMTEQLLQNFWLHTTLNCSCGVGVASGIGLSQLISTMMQIPVAIDVAAIAVSVVFSMLIGVIFGLLPAVKAANLNPIDALRRV